MPTAGRPYTRQQARTDRACLIAAALVFLVTLATTLAMLQLAGLL
jgi:hypothetical protein